MICRYIYKGHTFNSEAELDDFLLERDKYLSKYGDIVFSMTTQQNASYDLIDKASKRALDRKQKWETEKERYTEDGIRREYKVPYMGVNEFLDGLTNTDDKLFFPEFIEHNYWTKRFIAWSEGDYNDDEKKLFGFDQNPPILDLHPELMNFKPDKSWTSDELRAKFNEVTTKQQQELRDKMENQWKNLALFGDIIHFIGLKLFSEVRSGEYKGKTWLEVADINMNLFLLQVHEDRYDEEKKKIRKRFTDELILQAIDYFKTLKNNLETKLSDTNLTFIPEPVALGELNSNTKGIDYLIGRIDLVVIDSQGNAHVVDYKTSPKPYMDYNEAKKLGYTYLLATYTRILAQNGLKYNGIRSFVAPIQLAGFRLAEDNEYTFDSIKSDTVIHELTEEVRTREKVINNLNEVISIPQNLTASSLNLISNVDKHMRIFFPEFGKKKSEEEVKAMIEAAGGFKKRTDLDKPYGYIPDGAGENEIITANDEVDLLKKVMAYYNTFQESVKGQTSLIKNALKEGMANNTNDVNLPQSYNIKKADWLRYTLSKYLNSNWLVLEGDGYDSAEEFGIIFVLNKYTKHVEIITTALNYLYYNPSKDSKMQNLTYGLGESDVVENSKPNSQMLEATNGNIRLMETLLVLNNMEFNDDINIAQIHVVNPRRSAGTWSPNEQMLYSFNKLMDLAKAKGKDVGENKLKGGKGSVKFANKALLALLTMKNIMNITGTRTAEKFLGMTSSINALDSFITMKNNEETLAELEKLKTAIENDKELSRYIKNPESVIRLSYHIREAVTAYALILWAIAELKGYDYKQLLLDHDKMIAGFFKGFYWQPLENPGNYASNILNTASRVMLEAYQNVRDLLSKEFREFDKEIEELKTSENFSTFKEYTYGNQSTLYTDIVYKTEDKDIMVKNPWDPNCRLSESKKKFTKMFLMKINKERYPNKSNLELEQMIKDNDYDFFKLPLVRASASGKAALRSIFDSFKLRISKLTDASYYRDKVSLFLSDEDEVMYKQSEEVFKMNNIMDTGNGPGRKSFIAKKLAQDPAYFEVDLENILKIHTQAYAVQREMDQRMPIIKAAAFSLKLMGDYLGIDFNADYETIEKTVKSKIKNESLIENPTLKVVAGVTKDIQKMASFMALAFAPIQASGQTLNGIFTSIKLHWTYDREMFSKEHLISSYKEVGKDLVHFGTTPTKCEAINRVYGINDMDINTYAQNLSTNKHGIFHFFDRYAFKMSSRPDFYNRMTLFLSLMKQDGCYEAHSLNEDGTLRYNCREDKRYAALWKSPKNSKEYNEALSLYISAAKLFVAEGAKNDDGTLFLLDINNPKELPRAYTVQESESRKDVADSMYGYYDHTKKALFFGEYLGSLLGQMRTYWSAKKNQYFAPLNSNKIKGRWVELTDENGKPLFYGLNENGEIDHSIILSEVDTGVRVKQWQGDYSEGVFVTLMGIIKEVWNNDDKSFNGMMATIREKYLENPDENYRRCYLSNLKILAYDTCAAIMLGALCLSLGLVYNDLEDEAKKSEDLTDAVLADMFGLVYKTFNYAKLDFFWWDSIFSPTIDWNPYVITSMTNAFDLVMSVATGDRNAFAALANTFGFARQNKPIFRYLAQLTEILNDD